MELEPEILEPQLEKEPNLTNAVPADRRPKARVDRSQWRINSPLHNKLAEVDRPVHAWYRFVLSFPPHLVREYLNKFAVAEGIVLDPFCGTGTTLVECKKHGIPSVGFEANPIAALASRVKVEWSISGDDLLDVASHVADHASRDIGRDLDVLPSPTDDRVNVQHSLYGLRSLDPDSAALLLTNSISERPLHRALILCDHIDHVNAKVADHLRLALAWTLVVHAGNIRFGPEVGITKPKLDCDVVGIWFQQCQRMAADLGSLCHLQGVPSEVIQGDSRDVSRIDDNSIAALFTSPPYPNEKDYTRTTRLESVILGLIRNKSDLRSLKEGLLRSNTRNVYVGDRDDAFVSDLPEVQRLAREIESRRQELGKDSGFERLYHRVTKLYFGGLARHLSSLRPKLKRNALLGYVVGDQASYLQVQIRTGEILAEIASRQGYEVVSIDLFRTRLATATRKHLREEVVVLRWKG